MSSTTSDECLQLATLHLSIVRTADGELRTVNVHHRRTGDERWVGFWQLSASLATGVQRCTLDLVARMLDSHQTHQPVIVQRHNYDPSFVWPDASHGLANGDSFEIDETEFLLELDGVRAGEYALQHSRLVDYERGTVRRERTSRDAVAGTELAAKTAFTGLDGPTAGVEGDVASSSSPPAAQLQHREPSSPTPSSLREPTPTLRLPATATMCSPTQPLPSSRPLSSSRQLSRMPLLRKESSLYPSVTLPPPRFHMPDIQLADLPDARFLTFVATQPSQPEPVVVSAVEETSKAIRSTAYRSPLLDRRTALKRRASTELQSCSKRAATSAATVDDGSAPALPVTVAARRPFAAPSFKSHSQRLSTILPPKNIAIASPSGFMLPDREPAQEARSEPVESPRSHYSDSVPSEPAAVLSSDVPPSQ